MLKLAKREIDDHNRVNPAQDHSVCMAYGTVLNCDQDQFFIQSNIGLISAKQAFGCLLRPEIGDTVLFTWKNQGIGHILSVLERPSDETATMQFKGNITLEAPQGRLNISTKEGIDLASGAAIDLLSPQFKMTTLEGDINIDNLEATGNRFSAHIKRIKVFAGTIDTIAERLTHRVKNWFRFVDGLDQLRAGNLMHFIRKAISMRATHTIITAKEDVKIDGKRIHMG